MGYTDIIEKNVIYDLTQWHKKYNKSIVLTEYGAGSISGIHTVSFWCWHLKWTYLMCCSTFYTLKDPPSDFSEEYQVRLMKETHSALDVLRKDFLVGEMVWNFADFMTAQGEVILLRLQWTIIIKLINYYYTSY